MFNNMYRFCLLVEAFYGAQHLDIATGSGDEVDDDPRTRVAGRDSGSYTERST